MALVNCEIVEDSIVGQVSGEGNITARELYIKPKEGFYVAAKDFADNTYDTYSSYVQGIIDFGPEGKLQLTDTTTPYADDNEVKITVNLFADYSITEDTVLSIDIDGRASATPATNVNIQVIERFSTLSNGSITIDLEEGVSVVDGGLISSGWLSTQNGTTTAFKRHQFTFAGQVGVESKVATITLKADANTDIDYVNFVTRINISGSHPGWFYVPDPESMSAVGYAGFRWVYDEYPNIGSSDVSINTSGGPQPEQKHFVLYYTPEPDFAYDAYDSGGPSSDTDRWNVFNAKVSTAEASTRSLSITNVTTDLGSLPSGSFNVIPSSGITTNNTPIVKVYGTPGAAFRVEFKESKVVEGVSSSRSTNTGAVDYFGGIIPNMPSGIVVIPRGGIYTFKMPNIAAFTTTGWKEFEMKITASNGTIIKSSAIKTGGTSVNIGASGSIVTNKFYQYPKVNIALAVKDITLAGWSYGAGYTDVIQLPGFGGSGSGKYGVPMMPASSRFINFEIRVTKTGGAFSLSNTFDRSQFVATERSNRDVVSFSNLKARIGEGLTDTTVTFATITGTIRCDRFGFGDQVYTLDLSEIFTFA